MTVSEQINQLRKSIDIDQIEDALDIEVVKTMGSEDIARCPLPSHGGFDNNPSFSINREKLVYYCFACGVGGNILDLIARILDVDYDEAYKFCRTYSSSDTATFDSFGDRLENIFASKQDKSSYSPLPRFSFGVIEQWEKAPTDYFEKRGINCYGREEFRLGFDPNHSRGDYVGPAAIVPHIFEGGLVGYQERWIDEDRPKTIPKYTNTKGFPKRETLFGYDLAVRNNSEPVVVVESALTAVYVHQLGFPSVATFGVSVTDEQIKLLQSFSWGVILAFDNDAAGHNAADVVSERLHKTIPVHVLSVPGEDKTDLNDLPTIKVVELVKSAEPWFMKGI